MSKIQAATGRLLSVLTFSRSTLSKDKQTHDKSCTHRSQFGKREREKKLVGRSFGANGKSLKFSLNTDEVNLCKFNA